MSMYNNNPLDNSTITPTSHPPHPTAHKNSVKPYGDEELELAKQINEQLATHGWQLRTLSKRKFGYSFYITQNPKDLRHGKPKKSPNISAKISANISANISPKIPKKKPPAQKYRRIIPQQCGENIPLIDSPIPKKIPHCP